MLSLSAGCGVDALNYVGHQRVVHLRKGDAGRVARVLSAPGVTVRLGGARGAVYVEVRAPLEEPLYIRMDDWRKIVPFIRYASKALGPLNTPQLAVTPPPDVLSPQPNYKIPPPPVNPSPGLTSLLARFDYETYRQIVSLLPLCRRAGDQAEWLSLVLEKLFPVDFKPVGDE